MYAITAVINRNGLSKSKGFPEGWSGAHALPTFYLDERTQGILNEATAVQIARSILMPFGESAELSASITAVRVTGEDNVGKFDG